MEPPFEADRLAEEHELLRATVRQLSVDKIAPRAAEVDATGELPWDVYHALRRADLHAVHIPARYGGSGADAFATAIVIGEVARACAASSLIPLVTTLGTTPLLVAGSDELNRQVLPSVASGEAMFPMHCPNGRLDRTRRRCAPARCGTATAGS